jgi:NitT/TauT family transport system substrate-binding protein
MALDELLNKIDEDKISRRTILKAGAAVGIGLAGATLAGCTSPTPTATPNPSTSPSATPTPAPRTKDTINVGYLVSDHDAPLFVALANGYFDKYGVKVNPTSFSAGGPLVTQIIGGTLDIGIAGIAPVISGTVSDPTVKAFAAVHENGSGLIVKKGMRIDTIDKLKGNVIAIPGKGSIQDVMLRMLLKANNIDYDRDVTVTVVPAAQMLPSLEAGSVGAYMAWEPFITQAEHQGIGEVLVRFEQILPNHPCDTIVSTTTFANKYPDSMMGFLKAHKDAIDFIKANPAKAAEITGGAQWTKVGTDIEEDAMEHIRFLYKPDEDFLAGSERFAQEMKSLALIKKDVTRNDIFDLSFVNQL